MRNPIHRTIRYLYRRITPKPDGWQYQIGNATLINYWNHNLHSLWLPQFIANNNINPHNKPYRLHSVFGDRAYCQQKAGDDMPDIFFSGENLKLTHTLQYTDHLLSDRHFDLGIGFEEYDSDNYIRFPLWICYCMQPVLSNDNVLKFTSNIEQCHTHQRKFASLIASVDILGLRTGIFNQLSNIDHIDCAGKLLHNCDDLWGKYENDKTRFLQEYTFNICPENSNCRGYVTEKIFEALTAGCIPIYWGCYNAPEPQLLNQDVIIFWNKDGDNTTSIKLIDDLWHNPQRLTEFQRQPKLTRQANEIILNRLTDLKEKLTKVFEKY